MSDSDFLSPDSQSPRPFGQANLFAPAPGAAVPLQAGKKRPRSEIESELERLSRLYTDTLRGLAAFKRMADTLSGTSDVREICDRVVQIFAEELILEYCSIMLLDDEGEWLTLQSGIGPHVRRNKPPPHGIHTQGRVFRVGEGVAGRAARTRQPILISDVRKDDRFVQIDSPISIRSILCLPMISGENVVGVINLSHPEVGFFNEHYLRVFSILATTVGHIVGFARQEKRLEELNRTLEDRVVERTKEIREYKDYLENLLENASDLIFTLDKAGRVLFVNRRIDDLGYGRGDVIQRPFKTFLRDAEEGRMIRRFLDKKQKAAIEIPLRSSQGAVEEYLCSFSPLHDTHGTFLGTLVIGKSVAEKKRFERKLAQAEKLASLGELVAGIAHELNNKLVPILAYSELLQLSPMGERDLKMVRTITDAALGAKSVVESLLGFARQEKPKKEKISLNDVMTNTLTVFKYRLKTEGIDLNLALDRSLPRTLADYRQMEQVFLNLVKNAVQSMEGTGGTLTIRSSRADELIQFDVIDTGPGIPDEIQQRIFDPFFTTKEVGKGTGLGLSLCYGIVNEHGGEMSVSSRPGETVFSIRVPIIDEEGREERPAFGGESGVRDLPAARLLVVEDEETQAQLLQDILAEEGHEVCVASSGEEAISRLRVESFDLVISDIRMPRGSGIHLYEWVRRERPFLTGGVIFTTGDTCEPRVEAFIKETGVPVIAKPYRLEVVVAAVREALAGRTTV
ncbi:MAG: GAF domain-containing protein [Nitrospirae bacterium]|nr:GAF domain-containing protein [Nitrospirota bacterium]